MPRRNPYAGTLIGDNAIADAPGVVDTSKNGSRCFLVARMNGTAARWLLPAGVRPGGGDSAAGAGIACAGLAANGLNVALKRRPKLVSLRSIVSSYAAMSDRACPIGLSWSNPASTFAARRPMRMNAHTIAKLMTSTLIIGPPVLRSGGGPTQRS